MQISSAEEECVSSTDLPAEWRVVLELRALFRVSLLSPGVTARVAIICQDEERFAMEHAHSHPNPASFQAACSTSSEHFFGCGLWMAAALYTQRWGKARENEWADGSGSSIADLQLIPRCGPTLYSCLFTLENHAWNLFEVQLGNWISLAPVSSCGGGFPTIHLFSVFWKFINMSCLLDDS